MKTAYIELNTTNQIHALSSKKDSFVFTYKGFAVFPCVKVTSLAEILSKDYDYFVMDMSVLTTYAAREFAKCDFAFLVCSLCEWKMQGSLEKIEHLFQLTNLSQESVTILNNLGNEKSTNQFLPKRKLQVVSFPFIRNPFHLQPKEFAIFAKLLERNI